MLLAKAIPPVAVENQSTVFDKTAVAESDTVPEPHLGFPVPTGAAGKAFMVAITANRVDDKQPVVVFLACA